MDDKIAVVEGEVVSSSAPLANDTLIAVARMAEARIDAVIKIKQLALKVTNARDWTDQQGNPYLQVSGAEKIANLFNISWSFLTPEPLCETDADGHYAFTFKGRFSMGGRSIEVEGSRSSRDSFFKQNLYENGKFIREKAVEERDNRRDVKMAALTNLLGNGITRLLGIRNLTWDDLEKFASIKKEAVGKVEYKDRKKDGGAPMKPPQSTGSAPSSPPGAANGGASAQTGGSPASDEPIVENKLAKVLFAKFKGKGIESGADMNGFVAAWFGTPGLELFKLPAKHFDACKAKIDELPNPEPGTAG